jgi:hypothetical protein
MDKRKVVVIEAEDWAFHTQQLDVDHPFAPITGLICGFVVREDRRSISITQQWFEAEGQVRQTITVPKKNILSRTELALVLEESKQAKR